MPEILSKNTYLLMKPENDADINALRLRGKEHEYLAGSDLVPVMDLSIDIKYDNESFSLLGSPHNVIEFSTTKDAFAEITFKVFLDSKKQVKRLLDYCSSGNTRSIIDDTRRYEFYESTTLERETRCRVQYIKIAHGSKNGYIYTFSGCRGICNIPILPSNRLQLEFIFTGTIFNVRTPLSSYSLPTLENYFSTLFPPINNIKTYLLPKAYYSYTLGVIPISETSPAGWKINNYWENAKRRGALLVTAKRLELKTSKAKYYNWAPGTRVQLTGSFGGKTIVIDALVLSRTEAGSEYKYVLLEIGASDILNTANEDINLSRTKSWKEIQNIMSYQKSTGTLMSHLSQNSINTETTRIIASGVIVAIEILFLPPIEVDFVEMEHTNLFRRNYYRLQTSTNSRFLVNTSSSEFSITIPQKEAHPIIGVPNFLLDEIFGFLLVLQNKMFFYFREVQLIAATSETYEEIEAHKLTFKVLSHSKVILKI